MLTLAKQSLKHTDTLEYIVGTLVRLQYFWYFKRVLNNAMESIITIVLRMKAISAMNAFRPYFKTMANIDSG